MPDAFGRLTPEEERARMLRMSPAGMSSGMSPGTLTPEQMAQLQQTATQDFAGDENKISTQRAAAQALRGKAMDKPRENRVDTAFGEIYMGPNYGDMVGNLGEAFFARKATKEADEAATGLSKARGEAQAAEAALEQNQRDIERGDVLARDVTRNEQWEVEQEAAQEQRDIQNKREEARIADAKAAREESANRFERTQARLEEQAELAEDRFDKSVADTIRREDRAYQTDLNKSRIPEAKAQLGTLEEQLAPYVKLNENGKYVLREDVTEIPGVGGASNIPLVGDALTYATDKTRKGTPGKDIRQQAQKVYNAEILRQAGTATSAHEMTRQLKAQGTDVWSDAESFLLGLNAIKGGYQAAEDEWNMAHQPAYERRTAAEAAVDAEDAAGDAGDAPEGVDPAVWAAMTDEERALWQ